MQIDFEAIIADARTSRKQGRRDDAIRDLLDLVEILRESGPDSALADALRELGEAERGMPDRSLASNHYEEAVAILRNLDDPLRLAHTIRHLGDVLRENGANALAERNYEEALDIYHARADADPLDVANAVRPLALLREENGDRTDALYLWKEAHDLYSSAGVNAGTEECAAHLSALGGDLVQPTE